MTGFEISMCILAVLILFGYLDNIVKLLTYTEGGLKKTVRLIGIFVPWIGAIYGWF